LTKPHRGEVGSVIKALPLITPKALLLTTLHGSSSVPKFFENLLIDPRFQRGELKSFFKEALYHIGVLGYASL